MTPPGIDNVSNRRTRIAETERLLVQWLIMATVAALTIIVVSR